MAIHEAREPSDVGPSIPLGVGKTPTSDRYDNGNGSVGDDEDDSGGGGGGGGGCDDGGGGGEWRRTSGPTPAQRPHSGGPGTPTPRRGHFATVSVFTMSVPTAPQPTFEGRTAPKRSIEGAPAPLASRAPRHRTTSRSTGHGAAKSGTPLHTSHRPPQPMASRSSTLEGARERINRSGTGTGGSRRAVRDIRGS